MTKSTNGFKVRTYPPTCPEESKSWISSGLIIAIANAINPAIAGFLLVRRAHYKSSKPLCLARLPAGRQGRLLYASLFRSLDIFLFQGFTFVVLLFASCDANKEFYSPFFVVEF